MNKENFPHIALAVGLVLAIGLWLTHPLDPEPALPLLTLLLASEFGFLLTGGGAVLGVRRLIGGPMQPALIAVVLGCALLSLGFLWMGLQLWPEGGLSG